MVLIELAPRLQVVEEYERRAQPLSDAWNANPNATSLPSHIDPRESHAAMLRIYDQFIRQGADQQVNIDAKTRGAIEARLLDLSRFFKLKAGNIGPAAAPSRPTTLDDLSVNFNPPTRAASATVTGGPLSPRTVAAIPSTAVSAAATDPNAVLSPSTSTASLSQISVTSGNVAPLVRSGSTSSNAGGPPSHRRDASSSFGKDRDREREFKLLFDPKSLFTDACAVVFRVVCELD